MFDTEPAERVQADVIERPPAPQIAEATILATAVREAVNRGIAFEYGVVTALRMVRTA